MLINMNNAYVWWGYCEFAAITIWQLVNLMNC